MPASIGWRKREEDGLIVTWNLPHGAEELRMLPASEWESVKRVEAKYGDICRELGGKHLLPDGLLQAMILREGGLKDRAFRQEPKRRDEVAGWTGIGPLQITHPSLKKRHKVQVGTVEIDGKTVPLWKWEGGYTDEQLYEPRLNIGLGANYASELAARPDVKGDMVKMFAAFNAGSVRDTSSNPFGMVSTGNHIDYEVRAFNTWTYLHLEGEKFFAAQAFAKNFPATQLIDDHGPAGLDDDPPTPRNT